MILDCLPSLLALIAILLGAVTLFGFVVVWWLRRDLKGNA